MKPDFSRATPRPWFQDEDQIWAGTNLIGAFEYGVFGRQDEDRNIANTTLTCYAVNNIERLEADVAELREALEKCIAVIDSDEVKTMAQLAAMHGMAYRGPIVEVAYLRALLARTGSKS